MKGSQSLVRVRIVDKTATKLKLFCIYDKVTIDYTYTDEREKDLKIGDEFTYCWFNQYLAAPFRY